MKKLLAGLSLALAFTTSTCISEYDLKKAEKVFFSRLIIEEARKQNINLTPYILEKAIQDNSYTLAYRDYFAIAHQERQHGKTSHDISKDDYKNRWLPKRISEIVSKIAHSLTDYQKIIDL